MKTKSSTKSERTHHTPNFELSLKRLEEIVEFLERGNAPLDEVIKMYEEGVQISKVCLEHLSQAELKLKKLVKNADGVFELFDEPTEE